MNNIKTKDGIFFAVFMDSDGDYFPIAGIMMDDTIEEFINTRAIETLRVRTQIYTDKIPEFELIASMQFPMDQIDGKIERFRGEKRSTIPLKTERNIAEYLKSIKKKDGKQKWVCYEKK